MEFLTVKSLWREEKGFSLLRGNIGEQYIFLHFLTPAVLYFESGAEKVRQGGCVIYESGSRQEFSSPECELIHDWFHADEGCGRLMEKYEVLPQTVYYPENSREITDIITETELELIKKDKYYKDICSANAEKLFARLSRAAERNAGIIDTARKDEFVKARTIIHADFRRDWSVEEMARLVNLSASRFYDLYKKIFGITPQKDLCTVRIQRAQAVLMREKCTVAQAAQLCGYNNEYHFIRQFKKITGTTPGKLNKIGREEK